jgi:hypothetical protein
MTYEFVSIILILIMTIHVTVEMMTNLKKSF